MTLGSRRSHLTVVSEGRLYAAPRSGSVALSSGERVSGSKRVDRQKIMFVCYVDVSTLELS